MIQDLTSYITSLALKDIKAGDIFTDPRDLRAVWIAEEDAQEFLDLGQVRCLVRYTDGGTSLRTWDNPEDITLQLVRGMTLDTYRSIWKGAAL